jgi:hypothetical protein
MVRRAAAVHSQRELNFGTRGASEEGYNGWLAIRQLAVEEVAKRMNLPLGHEVEVWLTGGIRLRGRLRLQEGLLFIEEDRVRHLGLIIENIAFTYREMESCVRTD